MYMGYISNEQTQQFRVRASLGRLAALSAPQTAILSKTINFVLVLFYTYLFSYVYITQTLNIGFTEPARTIRWFPFLN